MASRCVLEEKIEAVVTEFGKMKEEEVCIGEACEWYDRKEKECAVFRVVMGILEVGLTVWRRQGHGTG